MNKRILVLIMVIPFSIIYAQNTTKYNSRYTTTAHRLLALEEQYSNLPTEKKNAFYNPMYEKLDLLMDTAKVRLANAFHKDSGITHEGALTILATIDSMLTEQYFYVCIKVGKLSDALTPHRKEDFSCTTRYTEYRDRFSHIHPQSFYYGFDCDLGAFLYLSIGEVLGLPLNVVEVYDHSFIRWRFPDKAYLNWDSNYGVSYSDDYYRIRFDFTLYEEIANHFMTNMSQEDITGYYIPMIAYVLKKQGRYAEAEQLYLQALAYRPYDAFANNYLSWMYLTVPQFKSPENYKKAYQLSIKADSLLPRVLEYRDTYSCACAAIGDFNQAIAIEKTARNKKERIEGYLLKKTCLDMGEK